VIIASGKLKSKPISNPYNQGETGILVLAIKKPIAKRLTKEPIIAVDLSLMESGIINKTSMTPNIKPAIAPVSNLSIFSVYQVGILSATWLRNPSINLTDSLSSIIKAFQNPIWAEQARERLKQIKTLTLCANVA